MAGGGIIDEKAPAGSDGISPVKARGGIVSGRVQLVLTASLALAIVAFVVVYTTMQGGPLPCR